ncbi:MAG TPA: hypothetical protein VEN81_05040, partial [Planctomycetota bacterium]|nr:hypothetical protein [Planctomycetota bacterium]
PSELTIKIDRETAILVDGEKAKVEDLKPGMPIRAWVRRELAVRIEGSRKPDPGKPAGAAPEPSKPRPAEVPAAKPVEKPKAPEPPPEPPKPFPVDEAIVPKGEKYPDLGGRVLSVFADGPMLLVTIRQNQEELPFYIPQDATVTYVGLEKPDQKPRAGYLAYVWLRPGSKEIASSVRFGRSK